MAKKDYYEILGLNKNASQDEIKKAYRKLAKELHPDKGGDEDMFKEVSEAYDVLSDSKKKENYDRFGHNQNTHSGPNMDDIFSHFQDIFGRRPTNQTRMGQSLTITVSLTLEEIFSGVVKTYNYNRNVSCNSCDGHGGSDPIDCVSCNGLGYVTKLFRTPMGVMEERQPCPSCDSLGVQYKQPCKSCKGSGLVNVKETVEVTIPEGVQDGMTFVMEGKGQGIKSGNNGDLHIRIIETPHKVFTRIGSDLKMSLKLSYPQLVLGDKVEIETIDGGRIRMSIPEYSDVGSNLRVPNKGFKTFGKDSRGDLIVTLGIEIPKKLDDETKEAIINLKEKFAKSE